MKKYILLAYRDEKLWQAMTAGERAAFVQACQASEQDLVRSLRLLAIKDLQNDFVLTVRTMNGKIFLTDIPVTASQEQLIQLLYIQARDLNAAIQIASKMPQAQAGPIEVRPIGE